MALKYVKSLPICQEVKKSHFMKEELLLILKKIVNDSELPFYREPLLGVAGVENRNIRQLKSIVHPDHLYPEDILPGARIVIAYFLPFKEYIVKENRAGVNVSRLWAEVYIQTNALLQHIAEKLGEKLSAEGFKCAWEKPTHNFDEEKLISYWSHKHLAFACGLGKFGKNRLLITEMGCAGRIGSVVTDCGMKTAAADEESEPFYDCPGQCRHCIRSCPAEALGENSFDRKLCYGVLLENDRLFPDLGLCDVCGKCSTGPCACL